MAENNIILNSKISKTIPRPEKRFDWTDNKVIDFVNWYVEVHQLDFRYTLENRDILDSFKNGEDPKLWHPKTFRERIENEQ